MRMKVHVLASDMIYYDVMILLRITVVEKSVFSTNWLTAAYISIKEQAKMINHDRKVVKVNTFSSSGI